MVQALIFDVDGTLAETEDAHRGAFNDSFAEFGLGWHWPRPLYRELLRVTGGKERMRAYVRRYLCKDPACFPIEAIHGHKNQRYRAMVARRDVALRPGIGELIAGAERTGLRLAIATTTDSANVDALIGATFGRPAAEVFEVIAAGDMVQAKKPAPDVYRLALARLGLRAADCIAFEDSANGLAAAHAAGIACVVAPCIYTKGEDFSHAALVLESFAEVASAAALAHRLSKAA